MQSLMNLFDQVTLGMFKSIFSITRCLPTGVKAFVEGGGTSGGAAFAADAHSGTMSFRV